MKQVHLKLLLCLLLATSATGQYNNYAGHQYGHQYGGQPLAYGQSNTAGYGGSSGMGAYSSYTQQPAASSHASAGYGQVGTAPYVAQTVANPQTNVETPATNTENTSGTDQQQATYQVAYPSDNSQTVSTNVCYNIIDSDYPYFSEFCSVLPQTTFTLPNFFGHQTREEANNLLTAFIPSFNSGCFSKIRMFVCPLFFPSCEREQTLPCASFCRAIQKRCRGNDLPVINCDYLPEKSTFCPVITTKYRLTGKSHEHDRTAYHKKHDTKSSYANDYSQTSASTESSSSDKNNNYGHESSYGYVVQPAPYTSYGNEVKSGGEKSHGKKEKYGSESTYGKVVKPVAPTYYGNEVKYGGEKSYGKKEKYGSESTYGKVVKPVAPTTYYGNEVKYGGETSYGKKESHDDETSHGKKESHDGESYYGYIHKPVVSTSYGKKESHDGETSHGKKENHGSESTYGYIHKPVVSTYYGNEVKSGGEASHGKKENHDSESTYGYIHKPVVSTYYGNEVKSGGETSHGKKENHDSESTYGYIHKPVVSTYYGNEVKSGGEASHGKKENHDGGSSYGYIHKPVVSTYYGNEVKYGGEASHGKKENHDGGSSYGYIHKPVVSTYYGNEVKYGGETSQGKKGSHDGETSHGKKESHDGESYYGKTENYGESASYATKNQKDDESSHNKGDKHTTSSSYGHKNDYGTASSYDKTNDYSSSYNEKPTGKPSGIQSTGEYNTYYEEKVDTSKCGPEPADNPCTVGGPQYFPLAGSPNCYIQCAFDRMFIKPCPYKLVWNPRINVCDWPTVATHSTDDNHSGSTSYNSDSTSESSYSYARSKRSNTQYNTYNPKPSYVHIAKPVAPTPYATHSTDGESSYAKIKTYETSYPAKPTGKPYGIQSTGEYKTYYPEVLDISKCGPAPYVNPCKAYGPQYFPLPGSPNCYIQCSFDRMFIMPCPYDLVWNSRINACDWPTVAESSESDKGYGESSYKTAKPHHETESSYSYGKQKRSMGAYQTYGGEKSYASPAKYIAVATYAKPATYAAPSYEAPEKHEAAPSYETEKKHDESSYGSGSHSKESSYGKTGSYETSYPAKPTGKPYGIQSTGEYKTYYPEVLDTSKCGPAPYVNPCKAYGPQYFPLPGSPNCYIQCSFDRMFIMPCPFDLVWNSRINTCDWPTVATSSESDKDDSSSSYKTAKTHYGTESSYSYGKQKRSIRAYQSYGGEKSYASPAKYVAAATYAQPATYAAPSYEAPKKHDAAPSYEAEKKHEESSYGKTGGYETSYPAKPTGKPYGIQSTGDYKTYYPEVLDTSKCGPAPYVNPCKAYGPQYFPLPGSPNCYIQCSFDRMFIMPCPYDLVWNSRINTCDWPTVAESSESDKDDSSSSYKTGKGHYGTESAYSYGKQKRSMSAYQTYGGEKSYASPAKYVAAAAYAKPATYAAPSYEAEKKHDESSYEAEKKHEESSYGKTGGYETSYPAKPTGKPYGIQSTGDYKTYYPEVLDTSKCGPAPYVNPCKAYGPQYFPLPGSPNCYIQCSFDRMFIMPCPYDLVWNSRINTCDWPTVAESSESDKGYGESSYKTAKAQYGTESAYSYGKQKRSMGAYQTYGGDKSYASPAKYVAAPSYAKPATYAAPSYEAPKTYAAPSYEAEKKHDESSYEAEKKHEEASYGKTGGYETSYPAKPTGKPYGIQSTGDYKTYYPEVLDISKCGPVPSENPCKAYGPQYFPLPGSPNCYIQCAYDRMFVMPCPYDLVWNSRINVCDWPTVATSSESDKDGSSSYNTGKADYGTQSSYSYGRKKRSMSPYQRYGGEKSYASPAKYVAAAPYAKPATYAAPSYEAPKPYAPAPSYGKAPTYETSYPAKPTATPYGIQSTGEYNTYYPEVLDISKCGPAPYENPCKPYGPQYLPLPGSPNCYIQCAYDRMFVMPCPYDLVWNSRINACDWPTVAEPSESDKGYGESSYKTAKAQYGTESSNSYGKQKRSMGAYQTYGGEKSYASPAKYVAAASYAKPATYVTASYGKAPTYETSYPAKPTAKPYGIQSTGEYNTHYPEVLDISKCGPAPYENPCKPYGPQYLPLPGSPNCYIQCAYDRVFVMPCPYDLVWNSRINACDWPTVAEPSESDKGYGESSYKTAKAQYGTESSNSYGKQKRSMGAYQTYGGEKSYASPAKYVAAASYAKPATYAAPSYDKAPTYETSYPAKPTAKPYGIQSTGEYTTHYPEVLDISKCGPAPYENPCKPYGPQYLPLPGSPNCYIQCAYDRVFVMPCPYDLVWNSRINACDWPTVAEPSESDKGYGESSYKTAKAQYGTESAYSYGKQKRSMSAYQSYGGEKSYASPAKYVAAASYAKPATYAAPSYEAEKKHDESSYGSASHSEKSSYGKTDSYETSYPAKPTGKPYGIQSTGEYKTYYPEVLDISKCGPAPYVNPCKAYGPQYFPLPGSPNCYIQCAYDRMFVMPCPYDLVWNSRINVCDWPTVATSSESDKDDGSSSYKPSKAHYGTESTYSYGRKKRSNSGYQTYGAEKTYASPAKYVAAASYAKPATYAAQSYEAPKPYAPAPSYGKAPTYETSYPAKPTAKPYGIQSTGVYNTYYPEVLDISKCGPAPYENPCKPYGPQYFPLAGSPNCYIQCAYDRMFVMPCPYDLVWNSRINACDWPTVAEPSESDKGYGESSYKTAKAQYGTESGYSYGKQKRSMGAYQSYGGEKQYASPAKYVAAASYAKPATYAAPSYEAPKTYAAPSYEAPKKDDASSSYGSGSQSEESSYSKTTTHDKYYQAKPTGKPYGIQSTGEYKTYYPEVLDISKCGPAPYENPCKAYGPQYFPLAGSPNCYIQCAYDRMFIMPCPYDLVWNSRINACDWPTVAEPSESDKGYGESSDKTAKAQYGTESAYSYGRKKRSNSGYQTYGAEKTYASPAKYVAAASYAKPATYAAPSYEAPKPYAPAPSYGKAPTYETSYPAKPTAKPYGIQSTGEYKTYYPEVLDISKCGPAPYENPCKPYGPQYFPLAGSPNCYIQCAYDRMFILPCPYDLVWNSRINACDWPTVAEPSESDKGYGESSDKTAKAQYGTESVYSYGKQKRSMGAYQRYGGEKQYASPAKYVAAASYAKPATYAAPSYEAPKPYAPAPSYGKAPTYETSYPAKPTGKPYGIQSTGEYKTYYPEVLDISKCGPAPYENPCKPYGPQYLPLPGSPNCYIQCSYDRMFVMPCPYDLVWNSRINACDWPTVAEPSESDKGYGESSYKTAKAQYGTESSNSYGKQKRSMGAYQRYGGEKSYASPAKYVAAASYAKPATYAAPSYEAPKPYAPAPSYGKAPTYETSYPSKPTGKPYGIQSTGEYKTYYPEVLDISKCGPAPYENPCKAYGPQYFPLAGSPNCYIQCSYDRMFIMPCPYDLVWNSRINACDWPTVAVASDDHTSYGSSSHGGASSNYGSSSEHTVGQQYGSVSSDSYGKSKRSTKEKDGDSGELPYYSAGKSDESASKSDNDNEVESNSDDKKSEKDATPSYDKATKSESSASYDKASKSESSATSNSGDSDGHSSSYTSKDSYNVPSAYGTAIKTVASPSYRVPAKYGSASSYASGVKYTAPSTYSGSVSYSGSSYGKPSSYGASSYGKSTGYHSSSYNKPASYGTSSYGKSTGHESSSYGKPATYETSYPAKPTARPYGIQSTGEYKTYYPEVLDISKCGPAPAENPCTPYGPQYFPLPGSPNCYIQCIFGSANIKPCPYDLVWNARINVCDWPTVAEPSGENSYGSSSYGRNRQSYNSPSYSSEKSQYESKPSYSYGKTKRSMSPYGTVVPTPAPVSYSKYGGSSYGKASTYETSYPAKPTARPYGIQSTGEYKTYYPEVLDISKCGPAPAENPCTPYGPQYFPLPGSPNCYIQCIFGSVNIKPCPYDLVWNARINVCDWPTVAEPSGENGYGSASEGRNRLPYNSPSYSSEKSQYESKPSYSYGKTKRSMSPYGTVVPTPAPVSYSKYGGSSYGKASTYETSYPAKPTARPYGIQSTGEYKTYYPEVLDISKCGPAPAENPCTPYGPQYFPLPGSPNCYIQCIFGSANIKPCPYDLVWNARINGCDWPTVAEPSGENGYGSASEGRNRLPYNSPSYSSEKSQYESKPSYSYGKTKRSMSPYGTVVPTPAPVSYSKYGGSSYGKASTYETSYPAKPTVRPYGIQSTGEYKTYYPEVLDISKCGPAPAENPCTPYGPQYFPLPGSPNCYIQCIFGSVNIKPCPYDLVWNARINVCDWPTVAEPSGENGYGAPVYKTHSTAYENEKSNSYGRNRRSTTERKKRFFPGGLLPSPVNFEVPLGPPIPGLLPLPGFPGPIGIPGPLIPPMGLPFPPFPPMGLPFPPFPPIPPIIPPIGPIPPPILPGIGPPLPFPIGGPMVPPLPLPLGGPLLPPLPMSIPATFVPGPPPIFGPGLFGPLGGPLPPFGGGFGPLREPFFPDPFDQDFGFGGGFPFGNDFYGGHPEPFFEPFPFPGGYDTYEKHGHKGGHKNSYGRGDYDGHKSYGRGDYDGHKGYGRGDYDGHKGYGRGDYDDHKSYGRGDYDGGYRKNDYGKSKYSHDDDDYGYSRSSDYKMNGNFQYGNSKGYGGSSYKNSYRDNDYSNDYYRKKRQISSYDSMDQQSRLLPTESIKQSLIQPSPCIGKNDIGNIAHPTDSTKYISCLNEYQYEIMDCAAGLHYNALNDKCEKLTNPESICERERPCMNDGQCYQTSPTTYKCTCRGSWTGERCETPLSSCASNPCGAGNECHTLIASDYKQDYVCLCNGHQSYGLTCERNTVPNPCMAATNNQEQYYSFAFSARTYLQCNGDLVYFRPCAAGLFWNQDAKICDHEITSPTRIIEDQPESYQTKYNSQQLKTTFTRPPVTSIDQNVDKQQGYRYRNYDPHMMTQGQKTHIQIQPRKQAPLINSFFTFPSMMKQNRRLQEYSSNNMPSSMQEQKSFVPEQQSRTSFMQTTPLRPMPRMFPSSSRVVDNMNTKLTSTS